MKVRLASQETTAASDVGGTPHAVRAGLDVVLEAKPGWDGVQLSLADPNNAPEYSRTFTVNPRELSAAAEMLEVVCAD